MKTLSIAAVLVITLLLSVSSAHSGPLEAINAPGQVLGAAGSYLPVVARSQQDKWVLIKVTPNQFSGFATPDGVAISGSYMVVQTLGAAVAGQNGTYSWPEQAMFATAAPSKQSALSLSRWLESSLFSYPADDKNPQDIPCYLLCILHEEATGKDKFTDVRLVPNDWQTDVLPAVVYLRVHPKLSELKTSLQDLVQTRALLHNPNPYLVLTAVQLLAAHKNLTTADMDVALSSADARVVACSLAITLFYSWVSSDVNAQWLSEDVSKIETMNQLEGFAVGFFATSPSNLIFVPIPTTDLPNVPITTPLVEQEKDNLESNFIPLIRRKLNALDPNGGASDERWRNIDSICQQREQMKKHTPK